MLLGVVVDNWNSDIRLGVAGRQLTGCKGKKDDG